MATLYDNIEYNFKEGLHEILALPGAKRADFCVGYFNLRGWKHIEDQIEHLEGEEIYETDSKENETKVKRVVRLLVGMHRPDEEFLRILYSGKSELMGHDDIQKALRKTVESFKQQLIIGNPTKEAEDTLRHLSQQMKDGKVRVKLFLRYPLHAKLYITHFPGLRPSQQIIMGSSNLTYSGLFGNGELNTDFMDSDHVKKLSDWFNERWEDKQSIDITNQLIEIIDNSWAGEKPIPPYYIYLKTAWHLSREARNGLREYILPEPFRSELFEYQKNAVQIAAKYITNEKRKGAMIGDVVGLGKTLTACAISKIFEDNFGGASTLIICPANLTEMWEKYIKKYDLKATVHSMAKNIDVEGSRVYRLIIVDESHNLRNSSGKRYQNIHRLIEHQNSSVLLLTATPYNKDFSDLGNQLKLFIDEDQDLGIRPENYIRELGDEYIFADEHPDVDIRSIKAFGYSQHPDDWNELMKLFLVRRTRSFIKKTYAKLDKETGRYFLLYPNGNKFYFPDRIPKSLTFETTPGDQYTRLYSDKMVDLMGGLKLPRYGLLNYYDIRYNDKLNGSEKKIIDNLSKAGERMMGFVMSTFFKRIDSSGYSFLLTLCRHILRNAVYYYAITHNLELPIGDTNSIYDAFTDEDEGLGEGQEENKLAFEREGKLYISTDWNDYLKRAAEYYEVLKQKNNCKWIGSKYFKPYLQKKLKSDSMSLIEMIKLCGEWFPENDKKLQALIQLLTKTHGNEKVLIFTQYADTANYLGEQLEKVGIKNVGVATGNSSNPTEIAEKFSPLSNQINPPIPKDRELRVLVATDVLSEGQNLQDSHIIVNYDLPWAIIRLIQRAGRIDRIGQEAKEIYCYSFFPAKGVEDIIRLRERLNQRINENAQVIGSDETFFEGNEQNLRDMFNEKSGILDNDDDNDVDLGSQALQIWETGIKKEPELAKIIPELPDVIYSTKQAKGNEGNGVITYTRTYNDFDVLTWLDENGEIISQSQKRILQAMECEPDTPELLPLENHHELVSDTVKTIARENQNLGGILGRRMSTKARVYNLLLTFLKNDAVDNIFYDGNRIDSLKAALDEVYNYPMFDSTRISLGRMFYAKKSPDEIVDYILELRENGNFCNIPPENADINKDPKIICSLGIRKL